MYYDQNITLALNMKYNTEKTKSSIKSLFLFNILINIKFVGSIMALLYIQKHV